MIKWKNLPSFTGMAPGATAILNLPLGVAYDILKLKYVNGTVADVLRSRLKINGRVVHNCQNGLADYDFLNGIYDRGVLATSTEIYFQRPEMTNVLLERLTSLGTMGLQSVTLELDIDPGAAANFRIDPVAVCSPNRPLGFLTKIMNYPFNASIGKNDCTQVTTGFAGYDQKGNPLPVPTTIAAIHARKAAGDITAMQININGDVFWEEATAADLEELNEAFGRVPAANTVSLDFILDGDPMSALQSMVSPNFRLQPTCTTGGQIDFLVEYIDREGGLI